ncbi:MAG: hypothetical protein N3E44_05190, partial [Candidatus Bathyarchaeota archaeon]|nr:hypothetical protein [Candidatus Bathyarchaeota archaeon]
GFKSLEEVSFSVMTMRLSLIELAKIAPSIAEAAANGDRVAMEIMEESGRELALLAIACLRKLKLEHGLVGASGGVFRCKGLLWDTFKSMITSVYPYIDIIGPIYGWQPAAGAIFLAAYEKSVRMSREKLSRLMEAIRIEEDRFLGFST